jgi:hypothetical protein
MRATSEFGEIGLEIIGRFGKPFKLRLDRFADVTENNAVVEDYKEFLRNARKLHALR